MNGYITYLNYKIFRCDPDSMEQYIPGLLYTVRMIYATSRYYNTTKQVSTLLVKVTNQILNMCMNYLTNSGRKTIWNQDKLNFIKKSKVRVYLQTMFLMSSFRITGRERDVKYMLFRLVLNVIIMRF